MKINEKENLKKGFGGDYWVKMKPNHLHILCEVEWPLMGGWSAEDTMSLKLVKAVYTVVTGEPGHLDQYPYIDSWLGLAQRPPTWTRFCIQKGKGKILIARKSMIKKEILQDLDGDDLTPPPYWIMMCLLPSAPPESEATLMPDPGPSEVPVAATALLPALLETVEPLFQQAPVPTMETYGQCPQNSTSAGPPRLYPPLQVSTDGKGEENTGIRQRLCSTKEQGERTPLQMPLRELQKPPVQDACGHYRQPPVAYYYQPFSSMDILIWQRHTPPCLGEPQVMIRLMETIF